MADVDGLDAERGPIYDGVRTYRRAAVMVDVDQSNSYLLDLFWARGGTNHRLIQNSGSPDVTFNRLEVVKQKEDTYAGSEVAYGEEYDGKLGDWQYAGSGFQFLKNVEREEVPGLAPSGLGDRRFFTMARGWSQISGACLFGTYDGRDGGEGDATLADDRVDALHGG